MREFKYELKFDPRDLWIGVFWDWDSTATSPYRNYDFCFDLYICIIPCLPLHFSWKGES